MDLETLKLILQAISEATGSALTFGIWYLVIYCVTSLIPAVLLTIFGLLGLRVIYLLIGSAVRSTICSWQIAREIGEPVIGTWTYEDTNRVLARVNELLSKEQDNAM